MVSLHGMRIDIWFIISEGTLNLGDTDSLDSYSRDTLAGIYIKKGNVRFAKIYLITQKIW